jgi:hypothetical protein
MCANKSRHRAERRGPGSAPGPQAFVVKEVLQNQRVDLEAYSRSPRHAQKVNTTYALYIGRVGALAVSLGVGVAVATNSGVAYANPDSDSGPAASTSPDSKSGTSTPSAGTASSNKRDDESTSKTGPPSKTDGASKTETTSKADGTSKADTPAKDGVPTMKVDSSGGAITSTHGTGGESGSDSKTATSEKGVTKDVPKQEPKPEASTPVVDEHSAANGAAPTEPAVEQPPAEPVVEQPPAGPVEQPPAEPVADQPPSGPETTEPPEVSPAADVKTDGSGGKHALAEDDQRSAPNDKSKSEAASTPNDDTASKNDTAMRSMAAVADD